MYTDAAIERRRCLATRTDDNPCEAWATWDDPQQRCNARAGRRRGPKRAPLPNTGHLSPIQELIVLAQWRPRKARPPSCRCSAYAFPHRHGAGRCQWPHIPALTAPITDRRLLGELRR